MDFRDRSPCGKLSPSDIGNTVTLAGWVDALRDHGDVLFIHLRDRSGIAQVVFSPENTPQSVCGRASSLRIECCIRVVGRVVRRAPGTENPTIATGDLEVAALDLDFLGGCAPIPFRLSEKSMVAGAAIRPEEGIGEDIRLQYRYLDLRRPSMQNNLIRRHRIVKTIRDYLDEAGFIEIETPILTRSTPEGARDYLVPSRHFPGQFYALPQSPQLFKQLLMVGGLERYFQIARCFRDEDLRPNRQPEFTQLDVEASFIDEGFFFELIEELTARIFRIGGITLPRPFPRMAWQDAMNQSGSDRPDLRFGMTFQDATRLFAGTRYGIFRRVLDCGGCIKGINVKGAAGRLSKNVLQNEYAREIVPGFGAGGMTWVRAVDGDLESNIVQFFSEEERRGLLRLFEARPGDVILMIADPSWSLVCEALGRLRLHLAARLDLIPPDAYAPLWVTDFPLFEATGDGVTSSHHPFTMPDRADFDPRDRNALLGLRSRSYDLVVNGEELGGGSIRIHDRELQARIFAALGLGEQEAAEKFGFFLQALGFGAPPHGGIALGLDRVAAMILGAPSIREVIAFPKNRSAFCPLTRAPSPVADAQLDELGLKDLGNAPFAPGSDKPRDLIDRLAWSSRIGISESERPALAQAVEQARACADRVNRLAGAEEEALYSVVPVCNRYREGHTARIHPLSENGELLRLAPEQKDGFYKVSAILD